MMARYYDPFDNEWYDDEPNDYAEAESFEARYGDEIDDNATEVAFG